MTDLSNIFSSTLDHNTVLKITASNINVNFDNYTSDLENLSDLLASGSISGTQYFKVKTLIRSSDPEVVSLGRAFIHKQSEKI